ncbi:MAG: AAA family ATPase [Caulobacteraceae bacterium]
MPTAHMIHGFLGAGKTTLARQLELELAAVRFTPDEWMARLFGEDPSVVIFQEKASAIVELMEPLWTGCLSRGVDVVLDFGFWHRDERDHVRRLAAASGAETRLYAMECLDEEAWRRIEARNGADERSLYIAPATFELLKERFEPLGADEVFVRG